MAEVRFGPAAVADIVAAEAWYGARSERVAADFVLELEAAVARIAENPAQFPVVLETVRRARMRRFPFALFFRVEDETAVVIACFHASRDPRRWQRR